MQDSKDEVLVERRGEIAVVTINRPHARNAVNRNAAELLARAFTGFDQDDTAKVAVFVGANGGFCAGADLKEVSEHKFREVAQLEAPIAPLDDRGPMGPTYYRLSKPVIGAISGHAVAGGLELALWCDMRIVEEDAVFGVYCRRWGVPLIDGGTVRLDISMRWI